MRLRALVLRLKFGTRRLAMTVRISFTRWQVTGRAVFVFAVALALAWTIDALASPDQGGSASDIPILIGIGAMFGGVLAIVFALSNFMLQRTADLYSSQFYEIYARSRGEKLAFVSIACLTVAAFGLAFLQDSAVVPLPESVLVYLVLMMIAAVFCLVDWQYTHVTKKTNPAFAIAFLERQGLKTLRTIHRFASDTAAWLRVHNQDLTQERALAVSYARFSGPHISQVDRQLENILEISLRLSARGEVLAAKRGLAAIHNVISRYLQLRQDSSLALPAGPYWGIVESDSSRFLARNYERVNEAAEKLLAQRQSEAVIFIMDLYASLVDDAKEIRFLNKPGENPILDQLRANFSSLLDAAIRANDLEVCFRSIHVSTVIGTAAVERGVHATTLTSVFADLQKVAAWAMASKNPVFVEHCTHSIVTLLVKAIEENTRSVDYQTREALKVLQSIASLMHMAMSRGWRARRGSACRPTSDSHPPSVRRVRSPPWVSSVVPDAGEHGHRTSGRSEVR